jgi:serine/threonine protein kinase
MNIGDYTLSTQLSDNTWEAVKISYDENTGEPETQRYIVKKVDMREWDRMIKLIELSKVTLSSMYIAVVVDIIENSDGVFIVSEFVEGKSLQTIIEEGLNDSNIILDLMNQISQAVDYIHRNEIAHGNIKPTNFIMDEEVGKLKLVDFSETCCSKITNCRYSGDVYYSPPETDPGVIDFKEAKAHDMWSTGVVYYKMANKNRDYINFSNKDPESMLKDIKLLPVNPSENNYEPINEIIYGLLDKNIESRMTSTGLTASIDLARPRCEIDSVIYTRSQAQAILVKNGANSSVVDNLDSTICKELTSEIKYCEINGNRYRRAELKKLLKDLSAGYDEMISGPELCVVVKRVATDSMYSVRATGDLLNMLEISSKLKGELLKENQQDYYNRYANYKELHMIDIDMLRDFQKDIYNRYLNYQSEGLEKFSKEEAFKNNEIVRILLDFQPDIEEYKNYLV